MINIIIEEFFFYKILILKLLKDFLSLEKIPPSKVLEMVILRRSGSLP